VNASTSKQRQPGAECLFALRGFAVLLLSLAISLLWGGTRLAALGGSFYYSLAGLALAACAILLWRRRPAGAWLYAVTILATVAWAVYESGFNGWALAPRLILLAVLGLWLVIPCVRRALDIHSSTAAHRYAMFSRLPKPGFIAGATGAAVVAGGLLHAFIATTPVDPVYRTGFGPPSGATGITADVPETGDWLSFGGKGGLHFSPLTQITPNNVGKLQVAWTYRTGDLDTRLEVNPLKVGDSVYICTGANDVISLDAESGKERWRFRSGADQTKAFVKVCRGVAYYKIPEATGQCAERILTNTIDARLIALDAQNGKLCEGFGHGGQISLLTGMGEVREGYYYTTSAPTIVRGKVVLGGWVADGQYFGEPSGVIRAYDAETGKFAWAFDVGRPDDHGEASPGTQYTPSTPNSWAPMSADENLGMVFVPTGNATGTDYFGGGRRPFDDRYSTSIVAIDAETGAVHWSFQTIHHDVWDYDLAPQPVLADIKRNGTVVHAVIQPTKVGEIYVLDRATGRPLSEVRESPVPQQGHVPEEKLSPTQPFSVGMPSFRGPDLREQDMWGLTPVDQLWCRIKFRQARYDGIYTPPGVTPSIEYPGYQGGIEWGSVSVNPERATMIVNSTRVAHYVQLFSRADADRMGVASQPDMHGFSLPNAQSGTPYAVSPIPFLSPLFVPCQQPPFGMLAGVNLATGKLLWTRPFGTARDSGPLGIPTGLSITLGTPNTGGALSTRSGLVFVAATQDRYLRAFAAETGRLLWEERLPAGAQATPMSFVSKQSGRQFIVVAAGGSPSLMTKIGDYLIAYALPKNGT
jgi:quinoprotein glucose dehydrogenase